MNPRATYGPFVSSCSGTFHSVMLLVVLGATSGCPADKMTMETFQAERAGADALPGVPSFDAAVASADLPPTCGDGTCASDENCTTCPSDCTCDQGRACVNDVCNCPDNFCQNANHGSGRWCLGDTSVLCVAKGICNAVQVTTACNKGCNKSTGKCITACGCTVGERDCVGDNLHTCKADCSGWSNQYCQYGCDQNLKACRKTACECKSGEQEACGNQGTKVCLSDCSWSKCSGQECTGPSTGTCGNCGTKSRACDNGSWLGWSACKGEGSCSPGGLAPCGNNGSKKCQSNCEWAACTGESGQTKYCGACKLTSDCAAGLCNSYKNFPALGGFCAPNQTCSKDSDCPTGWACDSSGGCWVKTTLSCSGNNVTLTDNCGRTLKSTACLAGEACKNGSCEKQCQLKTCGTLGKSCGSWSNGCGGSVSCGSCTSGYACENGSCEKQCQPKTCGTLSKSCGSWSNGCGGSVSCGSCTSGYACENGNCEKQCQPKTCSTLGKSCGSWSNGCGGSVSCGSCTSGYACSSGTCACSATTWWSPTKTESWVKSKPSGAPNLSLELGLSGSKIRFRTCKASGKFSSTIHVTMGGPNSLYLWGTTAPNGTECSDWLPLGIEYSSVNANTALFAQPVRIVSPESCEAKWDESCNLKGSVGCGYCWHGTSGKVSATCKWK